MTEEAAAEAREEERPAQLGCWEQMRLNLESRGGTDEDLPRAG